jgi:hypothetical protein
VDSNIIRLIKDTLNLTQGTRRARRFALVFFRSPIAFDLAAMAEVAGSSLNAAFHPHDESKESPWYR